MSAIIMYKISNRAELCIVIGQELRKCRLHLCLPRIFSNLDIAMIETLLTASTHTVLLL